MFSPQRQTSHRPGRDYPTPLGGPLRNSPIAHIQRIKHGFGMFGYISTDLPHTCGLFWWQVKKIERGTDNKIQNGTHHTCHTLIMSDCQEIHLIWLVPTATTGRAGTPSETPCTDAAQGRLSREGRASLCSVPRTYGRGLLGPDSGAEGYINM